MNYEERLQDLLDELDLFQDWTERYEYIISLGKKLPPLEEAYKTDESSSRAASPGCGCIRNRTATAF